MHILMWISSHKANRRTRTRYPVYFFNLKCDSEISTEIDILIILQLFSLDVFLNVLYSVVLAY